MRSLIIDYRAGDNGGRSLPAQNRSACRSAPPVSVRVATPAAFAPGDSESLKNGRVGLGVLEDYDTSTIVISEPVTFRGKAITVKSEGGPDETAIEMGTPVDPKRASAVVFESNETTDSVLDGFTITGGNGSWVSSASTYAGGGIYFDASSGTVRNCAIIKNEAGSGGGVFCAYPCSSRMFNCIIAENSAESGGGLAAWSGSSLTLMDCIIRGNSATGSTDGSGGGVGCWVNSRLSLTNCIVTGNSAAVAGGGIHTWQQSSCTVSNCVIALNTAMGLGGGGVGCCPAGSAAVTNSIFWENTAPKGYEILVRSGATFSISYSDVDGGQGGVGIEGTVNLNWGEGNIEADPLFADPINDDYHLKSQAGRWNPNSQTWIQDDVTSPCIDAGDPMSPIGSELFPSGGFVNIGAYGGMPEASKAYFGEPVCSTIIAGDINGDCEVNRADLEIMALHWTDEEPLLLP